MARRDMKKAEATFVCDGLAQATDVYLAGEFNDWNPAATRMKRGKDGMFRVRVSLPPGCYQYKFVADGVWMHDPQAEEQQMNSFGTLNSVIRVA